MGSPLLLLPLLLHTAWGQGVPEFLDLPGTVSIPESSAIGSSVYNFTLVNCSSLNPTVSISSVSPPASYFNTPTQRRTSTTPPYEYALEVTLSSTAALNAEVVNEYILEVSATCGSSSVTGQIFVTIINDLPEPQCDPRFSRQVGDAVRVYSNHPASQPVYVVVQRQPKYTPVTFQITSPSPTPFSIDSSGMVHSPASGFSNTNTVYTLQISVTDSRGNRCNGTLRVEVLPVYSNPINFTSSSFNFTIPENGNARYQVGTLTASGHNILYEIITPDPNYIIHPGTGIIRTTHNLDLDSNPALVSTMLEVRVYDRYNHTNSATATVSITVTDVNDLAPLCTPAIVVTQVPETEPIGSVLATLSCSDPDYNRTELTYTILPNDNSLYSFRIQNSELQINNTLNYDSQEMAGVSFQYSATIQVTDNGTPQLTTLIPVFVTVTPVNEFHPECGRLLNFSVSENAPFGTAVGQMNATDADYPFNNVEYRITGGPDPPVFYIMPKTGEIKLLGPLDYETRSSYSLRIQVVDLNNDIIPDPTNQKNMACDVTINVQDYNDLPPVCTPPFYHTTIYSTDPIPVWTLNCSDTDGTQRPLYYTMAGGNTNGRFGLSGPTVLHNGFTYNPDGKYDPTRYELLILVTDSLSSPQYSATATLYVSVIPWSSGRTTATATTTTPEPQTMIVTEVQRFWRPDVWFMVVLTLTLALLLAAIALLTWALCRRWPLCRGGASEGTETLLPDRSSQNPKQPSNQTKPAPPSKEKKDAAPVSFLSLQFDGRARDPVTRREYLFNSVTGARRWV